MNATTKYGLIQISKRRWRVIRQTSQMISSLNNIIFSGFEFASEPLDFSSAKRMIVIIRDEDEKAAIEMATNPTRE